MICSNSVPLRATFSQLAPGSSLISSRAPEPAVSSELPINATATPSPATKPNSSIAASDTAKVMVVSVVALIITTPPAVVSGSNTSLYCLPAWISAANNWIRLSKPPPPIAKSSTRYETLPVNGVPRGEPSKASPLFQSINRFIRPYTTGSPVLASSVSNGNADSKPLNPVSVS